ncbi:hypothetical protein BRC86_06070 [Halobacteriales archaeon QS_3_64_16]|nr:MAG: hypothetical protein BRC86_06070 [Halobacteriales archaeon QS_3_64_16]
MAHVEYVRREDATDHVSEILSQWEGEGGGTVNRSLLLDALANHPALLEGMYTLLDRTIRGGRLDRDLKELVSVVVSQANDCAYCTASHRENLLEIVSMPEERFEAVRAGEYDALPEHERAAARFAEQVALDPKGIDEEALDTLYAAGFDEEDMVELLGVAGTFVAANTYVDALSIQPGDREEAYAGAETDTAGDSDTDR